MFAEDRNFGEGEAQAHTLTAVNGVSRRHKRVSSPTTQDAPYT